MESKTRKCVLIMRNVFTQTWRLNWILDNNLAHFFLDSCTFFLCLFLASQPQISLKQFTPIWKRTLQKNALMKTCWFFIWVWSAKLAQRIVSQHLWKNVAHIHMIAAAKPWTMGLNSFWSCILIFRIETFLQSTGTVETERGICKSCNEIGALTPFSKDPIKIFWNIMKKEFKIVTNLQTLGVSQIKFYFRKYLNWILWK